MVCEMDALSLSLALSIKIEISNYARGKMGGEEKRHIFSFPLFVSLSLHSLPFPLLICLLGQDEFTERDVEVFKRYLTFCGIGIHVHIFTFTPSILMDTPSYTHSRLAGIQNAQLFENSVLEYQRNQILLNLARSIFEEQNNLECLVTKIMREARDLLKCERCAVFLVDLECCEAVIIHIRIYVYKLTFLLSAFALSLYQSNHVRRTSLHGT